MILNGVEWWQLLVVAKAFEAKREKPFAERDAKGGTERTVRAMSDKQKERIAVFVELVVCCIMSAFFLLLSFLSFIWRQWCVMGYGIANVLVFVYYAVKRVRKCLELVQDEDTCDED